MGLILCLRHLHTPISDSSPFSQLSLDQLPHNHFDAATSQKNNGECVLYSCSSKTVFSLEKLWGKISSSDFFPYVALLSHSTPRIRTVKWSHAPRAWPPGRVTVCKRSRWALCFGRFLFHSHYYLLDMCPELRSVLKEMFLKIWKSSWRSLLSWAENILNPQCRTLYGFNNNNNN